MAATGPVNSEMQLRLKILLRDFAATPKMILDFMDQNFKDLDFTVSDDKNGRSGFSALFDLLPHEPSRASALLTRLIDNPNIQWNLPFNEIPESPFVMLAYLCRRLNKPVLDQLLHDVIQATGAKLKFDVSNTFDTNAWFILIMIGFERKDFKILQLALNTVPLDKINFSILPQPGGTSILHILLFLLPIEDIALIIRPQLKNLPLDEKMWNHHDINGGTALFALMVMIDKLNMQEGWELLEKMVLIHDLKLDWHRVAIQDDIAQTPMSILKKHVQNKLPQAIALNECIEKQEAKKRAIALGLELEVPPFIPGFNAHARAAQAASVPSSRTSLWSRFFG